MTIGVLIPRDFLERQPRRWQKSQRKRGATKYLKRIQLKREKLERRVLKQRATPAPAPAPAAGTTAGASAPRPGDSFCTPFLEQRRGFWAAALEPYRPLVLRIPPGLQLCLLHAAVQSDGPADPTTLRCRVPANPTPATLCRLDPEAHANACRLQCAFSGADGKCALAAEGPSAVHVIGRYARRAPIARARPADAQRAAPDAAAGKRAPAAPAPPVAPAPRTPAASAPATAPPAGSQLRVLRGGLKVLDTRAGHGRPAASGDRLTVRYSGLTTDADGTWFTFDDNRGKQLSFTLGAGEMIAGWDVGLVGMRRGGVRRLIIPPSLGYGARAAGKIRADSTLVFEVELLNAQQTGGRRAGCGE